MRIQDFESYTFFPGQHWSHTWERQHEIVSRFAKELKSSEISVCSPLGLLNHNPFSIGFVNRALHYRKSQTELISQNPIMRNMKMVNSFHLPFHNNFMGKINFMALRIPMGLSEKNFFWSTYMNPTVFEFFKRSQFKVYDIAERRSTNPNLNDRIRSWEKIAVREADLVIVDNYATYEDYRALNANIHYIPQGVNLSEFFVNNNDKREYIGYIGNLHFAIDYDYFNKLIINNPNEKFLIIGGILEKNGYNLIKHPNVTYIPQVPKSDLNQYLAKIKIGLIPYIINDHTVGVYPTKLFEYLAAGVPVLSTPLPEVVQYEDKHYLKCDSQPISLSNLKFDLVGISNIVQSNTWDARWTEYKQCIASIL